MQWRWNRIVATFLAMTFAIPASAQSNWIDFSDETATRISADPAVTTEDTQEKDIATGDFDQDGDIDAVIVRKVPFSVPGGDVNVLLMNEGGVLTERTADLIPDFNTPDDARDVVVFDCNNNGWLDICVINTFAEQPRLFLNQGESGGVFQGWAEDTDWLDVPLFPPPQFCAVAAGDVTGDGFDDLFMVDYDNSLEDVLLVNDGTGKFADETSSRLAAGLEESAFGTSAFIVDLNMDGHQDILKLTSLFTPSKIALLINDGTGNFADSQDLPFDQSYMLDVADADNDGRPDIYVVSDNQDYVIFNDATHMASGNIFTTRVNVANSNRTANFGGNVHNADVNRDGFIDFAVADVDTDIPGCTRRHAVLENQMGATGSRGFEDPNNAMTLPWNTAGTFDFAWMDINQDGFMDMLLGTCSGLEVHIQQPFAAASNYGVGCGAGASANPVISSTGTPNLGSPNFGFQLDGAEPGMKPFLFFSTGRPDDLSNCAMIDFPFLAKLPAPLVDGSGHAEISGPIEDDPVLEGVRLFAQYLYFDTVEGGISWSNGLDVFFSSDTL